MQEPDFFSESDLAGLNVIIIREVDSTNNYANTLLDREKPAEGTIVLTFRQMKGRGYASNVWKSEPDQNLTFSIILYPDFLPAARQFLLSQAISVGIARFLQNETGGVSIKWPNDILIGDRKVAGILVENRIQGAFLHSSVIGIGLNLNQQRFPDDLPRAVSLGMVTGKFHPPGFSLKTIANEVLSLYNDLKMIGYEHIHTQYLNFLYRYGEISRFRCQGEVFEAKISGIDEYGQLVLKQTDGTSAAWPFKTLEMIF
jgi:BirA family biotin operon repressor/biotin-[acetyl-CoA-carboxylase] ligase